MMEEKILPEEIELSEIVLKKTDHAFERIRQEDCVIMSRKNKRTWLKSQAAVIAGACILAVSSASVAAAIHHYWGRGMNGNIQASDTQQQQLTNDSIAEIYPEKADYESLRVVDNGVTIAPDTVIVDERFAYMSFTISGYQVSEDKEPGFESVNVDSKDVPLNMAGSIYDGIVPDENGTPVYEDGSAIQFGEDGDVISHYLDENGNLEYIIKAFVADEKDTLLGKTVNVEFENLGTLYKTDFTNEKDGVWKFEMKLPDVSAAKHFDINKELVGADITVTDADISPISMRVNYTVSADMEANEDEIGIPEMKGVILKDGTRIPYLADGGNVGYTDEAHAYHITGYDRVVDVDEIQSLLLLVKPGEEPVSVDIQ